MRAINEAARDVAEVAGIRRVYPVGGVPAGQDRTYPYVVLSVTFDGAETYTLEAAHGVKMLRLTAQSFGTTLDAALDMDALIRGAFLDKRLPAPGWECDPAKLQVGGAVVNDPDAGQVIGITSTYRFAATKET